MNTRANDLLWEGKSATMIEQLVPPALRNATEDLIRKTAGFAYVNAV
jgi:hypothetical protein